MTMWLAGLPVLALLCAVCLGLAVRTGLDAALLPLPTFALAAVWLLVFGCFRALPWGLYSAYALLAAVAVWALWRADPKVLRQSLQSPGFLLFAAGALFFWTLFAVRQPMFTQWDEFTAWGIAPKMVKARGALYAADPVNLTAYKTFPATSLVSYFVTGLAPRFAEWQCLAALDWLLLACLAAAAALPHSRWMHAVLVFAAGAVVPFCFGSAPVGTPSTVYANAMADLPMALVFAGGLCLYVGAGRGKTAVGLCLPVLALLALIKDIAFAYALIAVALLALDTLVGEFAPATRFAARLGRAVLRAVVLALPVLAVFLGWNRYTAAVDPNRGVASVGGGGLSYGAVLVGGVKQLLGIGREEKFAQIMQSMAQAFVQRKVWVLGSSAAVVVCITLVAAAAWLASGRGAPRRRVLALHLGFAACFAALYLFHLILYHYNFSDLEGLALKDYERYLAPYYMAWLLTMLCLLGQAARGRLGSLALGGTVAAVLLLFGWRGVPAAGFWSRADTLYSQRADVARRAAAANAVLDWPDRVLVLSQGDNATRWYYYKYELTAKVVNGFGGFYGRLGETEDRWDSDFMNLVESENWTLYDFKAVCIPETLVAYMAEKNCDYLLIDRADGYLEEKFSYLFEGGLQADMDAALYHFEGEQAEVPFTLAATAESEGAR